MSVTPIWTAHCDRCAHWNEGVMGGTKRQVQVAARRQGWLVTKDVCLCPDCRKAEAGSDV